MIRAIAGALILVLAFAPSAWSECAWVLWAETRGLRYETVSASDTREVCERALGKQIARWKTGANVTVDDTTVNVRSEDKSGSASISSVRYVCLPDTVDPRGPKGGAR